MKKSFVGKYQMNIFKKNYLMVIGGFLIGVKLCDLLFYNPRKL
jgi:hypothetical protein